MPGATSSHSGCAGRGGSGNGGLARLRGDPPRQAIPQRGRRAQHVGGPGDEGVDDRTERLHLLPAIRTGGDLRLHGGNLVRRKGLQGVQAHRVPMVPLVVARCRAHEPVDRPGQRLSELAQPGTDSCLDGSDGLIQPVRRFDIGQLREERGLDRLSLFRGELPAGPRAGGVPAPPCRTPRAGRGRPPAAAARPPGSPTRFFRCSYRNRSIARERAWFMIQPTTEPPAGSYVDARRHTSWNTSSVSSSAVSRLLVIRTINVKTMRCVRAKSACSASWSPAAMDCTSLTQSCSDTRVAVRVGVEDVAEGPRLDVTLVLRIPWRSHDPSMMRSPLPSVKTPAFALTVTSGRRRKRSTDPSTSR